MPPANPTIENGLWTDQATTAICTFLNTLSNTGANLRTPYCMRKVLAPRCGDGQVDIGEQCEEKKIDSLFTSMLLYITTVQFVCLFIFCVLFVGDYNNPISPNNVGGCCNTVTCQWISTCSLTTYHWSVPTVNGNPVWTPATCDSTQFQSRVVSCLNNNNVVQATHTRKIN
jgi:hypothetical protein